MLKRILPILVILSGCIGCYRVKEKSKSMYFTSPAWTPDGRKLYFIKDISYSRTIVEWKPGGKELYQFRDEWYLMKCNPDGSDTTTIARIYKQDGWSQGVISEARNAQMDISSSGEIVINFLDPPGIFLMDTTGKIIRQVLDWGRNPRWAFDYTKIIFEGDDEHAGIWMMDKDGSGLEKVIEKGESPIELESVCRTTNEILFSIDWDKRLCTLSFNTQRVDTIITSIAAWSVSISADWDKEGNQIILVEHRGHRESGYGEEQDTLLYRVYDINSDLFIVNIPLSLNFVAFLRHHSDMGYTLLCDHQSIWRIKRDGTDLRKIFP